MLNLLKMKLKIVNLNKVTDIRLYYLLVFRKITFSTTFCKLLLLKNYRHKKVQSPRNVVYKTKKRKKKSIILRLKNTTLVNLKKILNKFSC